MELSAIRAVLDAPEFETAAALARHRAALAARVGRLQHLIHTIDRTLLHLQGEIEMTTQDLFAGFDEETQARYEKEAAEMYDPKVVAESSRRWKSYTAEDKARIQREGGQIYQDMVALLGRDPAAAEVQAVVARWHDNLRAFYEPTPDILRGLGQAYAAQPEFSAFFATLQMCIRDRYETGWGLRNRNRAEFAKQPFFCYHNRLLYKSCDIPQSRPASVK